MIVALAAGIASLVCWILTIITAFKKEDGPLFGILSICPIVGFILGWVRHAQWGHTKIMAIWTAAFVVNMIMNVVMKGMAAAGG